VDLGVPSISVNLEDDLDQSHWTQTGDALSQSSFNMLFALYVFLGVENHMNFDQTQTI